SFDPPPLWCSVALLVFIRREPCRAQALGQRLVTLVVENREREAYVEIGGAHMPFRSGALVDEKRRHPATDDHHLVKQGAKFSGQIQTSGLHVAHVGPVVALRSARLRCHHCPPCSSRVRTSAAASLARSG